MSDINSAGMQGCIVVVQSGNLSPHNQISRRELIFNHLFFVEQSHGLSITFELESVDKLISQNGMGAKLNDHGMTFGSQLHRVVFLSTWTNIPNDPKIKG